jgi:hypothetical protein
MTDRNHTLCPQASPSFSFKSVTTYCPLGLGENQQRPSLAGKAVCGLKVGNLWVDNECHRFSVAISSTSSLGIDSIALLLTYVD